MNHPLPSVDEPVPTPEPVVQLSQYQRANAVHKIAGYLTPQPQETPAAAFVRAKAETLLNLRRDLAAVEAIGHETFLAERQGKRIRQPISSSPVTQPV